MIARVLGAAAVYFAAVFAAGAVLGSMRQLVIAPRIGPVAALLIEAPLILAAAAYVAHKIVRSMSPSGTEAAAMGTLAFAMLLIVEAQLARVLRGWSSSQWADQFRHTEGLIAIALYLGFAALPWLLHRRSTYPS